ncbi:metal-dependent phosphoesterase [Thermoplasmatales archaeon SG8-52-2]|nr:MAG: metal-dependent phosphoesterase [Thermoplasmatales archaeon SG8-52-2]
MAITDHNSVTGSLKALEVAPKDFIVIPGQEISTLDGHVVALGIKKNIERELSVEETVDKIIDFGGIPIVVHLFRNMSGIKKNNFKKIYKKISAIEVFNSCSVPKSNLKSAKVANQYKIGGTGGSDSHIPEYAGFGYTLVDTNDSSLDSVLSQINKKKTWGEGNILPLSYRRDRMVKSVKQFFQRGFKRI